MTTETSSPAEELVTKVLLAGVGASEISNVYLGHTLGLYRTLADIGPASSIELAEASGCDERYVREWLQAQAVTGFVAVEGTDPATASFTLAEGGREVFVDELSPFYLAPLSQAIAGVGAVLERLAAAFRTGEGVPYSAYPGGVSAQAALNRPAFANELIPAWLPAIPGLTERLDGGARVADFGCGSGWSSVELAKAYPKITVSGYDADAASIAAARANAQAAGVSGRVTFHEHDLAQPVQGSYDVIFLFECVHDFGYPQKVLSTARGALAGGGAVIVMDEATDETLVSPTDDPVQRFFANVSPLWCLPQGRDKPDMDPVGTVMRPSQLQALATASGFGSSRILDIEHPFFRFYQLNA
ncbi:SAM-dependent methyltransferase [Rhizocola hellebori]|uniref:SAM-dependent methyltransferase n=1 Tax=Rhizocola hellebori TaxID=1392758 RepID=A0A8J3Q8C3_9ACTN|nr:methyltransferase domain-containing protein [Rhizocola hellebori]GIH05222.1 SAM-dependent methyltransferase [Rhizocola hellebori]